MKKSPDNKFAPALREWREWEEVPLQWVAKKVECTRQAVSLWELGARMPPPKMRARVARLFAPSMDAFLRGPR